MTDYTNASMQCVYPISTALMHFNVLTFILERKREESDLKAALVRMSEPQAVKPLLYDTGVHGLK